jgi:capsular polysaccharide biosynthesis protein
MEETVDLRPYLAALGRYLWLIGGAVVLAIVIAVAIYLTSNDYEAIALLTVPEPTEQLQFDARITTTMRSMQNLTVYPELAKSSDLLNRVLVHAIELTDGRIATLAQVRDMTTLTTSADNRLVRLVVTDEDPEVAAALANIWAEEFVITIETLFGRGGVAYFDDQLRQASEELRAADDALVAFQTTNRQGIVDNELLALTDRQRALLADESRYRRVLADIQLLRRQLENNTTDVVTLSDQLSALTVQLRAYETTQATPVAPQFQINIGADAQLSTTLRAELLQQLEALRVSVEAALTDNQTQLESLAAPIFALQTEKQQLFNQGERLLSAQEVAQETHVIVARKIDEERVAAGETLARVAGHAVVPDKPARPNVLALVSLLSLAALIPSILLVLFLTWWRGGARHAA